ncbi:hypothetical protein [uncultured Acetobacterium sp.]|uniref:hypothetical protein n=1 Tax=uncultured Acetobacterium sp. TaxID=217139 RepID=UPI0025DB1851|nr:hypothetical protein [uncultured Acetobacterium sp.]
MANDYCTVRLEMQKDWREVENLTREAFWNKYRPGCSEHFVLHQYRSRSDFVKELQKGYLTGVTGTYQDPVGYLVDDADVEAFDMNFSPKEKKKLPGQLV